MTNGLEFIFERRPYGPTPYQTDWILYFQWHNGWQVSVRSTQNQQDVSEFLFDALEYDYSACPAPITEKVKVWEYIAKTIGGMYLYRRPIDKMEIIR